MSFSDEVKNELVNLKIKKYCCRKAFLLGMLSDCIISKSVDGVVATYNSFSSQNCEIAEKMFLNIFHKSCEKSECIKLAKTYFTLKFDITGIEEFLIIQNKDNLDNLFEKGCTNCVKHYLRGVFVSLGTVSDASSEYHLEIRLKNASNAKTVYNLLCENGLNPKVINRKTSVGIYYKNSTSIEDVLTYLGAVTTVFDFINVKIEKDIRNSVNRGTNCVAGNISKSVEAAAKQVAAILKLKESGRLSFLPDDLFETAKLRLQNRSASLAELAKAHTPEISKSGLSHRLDKIMKFANDDNKNDTQK